MRKGLMIGSVAALLVMGLVAGACSPAANNGNGNGTTLKSEGKDDFTYVPANLTAKAGSITVEFHNSGALSHTFTIDNPAVDIVAAGGQTKTGTFTATAGTLDYYCKEPGHKEGGMVGKLTVS
jgi:plastocyanin